jgi:hypothetical protein
MARPGHVKKAAARAAEAEGDEEKAITESWLQGTARGWSHARGWLLARSTEAWSAGDEKKAHELKDLAKEMQSMVELAEKTYENFKSHGSTLDKSEMDD